MATRAAPPLRTATATATTTAELAPRRLPLGTKAAFRSRNVLLLAVVVATSSSSYGAFRAAHSLSMPPPPPLADHSSPSSRPLSAAFRLRQMIARSPQPPQFSSSSSSSSSSSHHSRPAIVLPGVHDALSARIYAEAGAKVLFLSGFGVSACRLGQPDGGILTLSEMEDVARSVVSASAAGARAAAKALAEKANAAGAEAAASSKRDREEEEEEGEGEREDHPNSPLPPPVIVDGDTGYGGASNIRRTIRGFASAGAAAVTIEDQRFPKRCTYAAGSSGARVVSREESIERIRAAVAARDEASELDGNEILVVARTDCRVALGFEEAAGRCLAYEEAGADVVYAENLASMEEYVELRRRLKMTTPMMLAQVQIGENGAEDGDGEDDGAMERATRLFTAEEAGEMGYSLALFGVTALQATVRALQDTAKSLLRPSDGGGGGIKGGVLTHDEAATMLAPFSELKRAVGFPDLEEFEGRYNVEA